MASNYTHNHIEEEEEDDEGYIDINLSSSSSSFCHPINFSSPQDIEFEFVSNDQEHVLPADELFYKGTLLPLHLPPRLQMLQNLLQNSSTNSCNNIASPSESFRSTSTDKLNDYFAELSDDNFIVQGRRDDIPKKSWPKKKLKYSIKKLLHFKSLFSKSSNCSDESLNNAKAAAVNKGGVGNISSKGTINTTSKKMSGWQIIRESVLIPTSASVMNVKFQDPFNISHRRSFCGAMITQNSTVKCSSLSSFSSTSSSSSSSSSSFSFDTNGSQGRSSGSDTEGSISAAIAHCKKSRDY